MSIVPEPPPSLSVPTSTVAWMARWPASAAATTDGTASNTGGGSADSEA